MIAYRYIKNGVCEGEGVWLIDLLLAGWSSNILLWPLGQPVLRIDGWMRSLGLQILFLTTRILHIERKQQVDGQVLKPNPLQYSAV